LHLKVQSLKIEESCRKTNSAKLFPELNGINTSVGEQTWVWINKLAGMLRHMNQFHFLITIYVSIQNHNDYLAGLTSSPGIFFLDQKLLQHGDELDCFFEDSELWYCGIVSRVLKSRVEVTFLDGAKKVLKPGKLMVRCSHKEKTKEGHKHCK
jgi:hypothetical protein